MLLSNQGKYAIIIPRNGLITMNNSLVKKRILNLIWPNQDNKFRPFIIKNEAILFFILLFFLVKILFSFELILIRQSSLFAEVNAQQILLLTNDIRRQHHLPPVRDNILLDKAAEEKAHDMLRNKYFGHFSPTGVSPWYWIDNVGYDYHYAGENLALNFFDSKEVIKAWLNSPRHRENLLNAHYQDMGIAILNGDFTGEGIDRVLVVQMFASPMKRKIASVAEAAPPMMLSTTVSTTLPSTIPPASFSSTTTILPCRVVTTISSPPSSLARVTSSKKLLPIRSQNYNTPSPSSVSLRKLFAGINLESYQQIDKINKILASLLILLGGVVISGIIWQQRKNNFAFSELIMRSVIIILLGVAFLTVHFPSLVGKLLIA